MNKEVYNSITSRLPLKRRTHLEMTLLTGLYKLNLWITTLFS